jgi:hypothetical protein
MPSARARARASNSSKLCTGHHQRIAIRPALRDESARNGATCAGAVFHHQRLTIRLRRKTIGNQAG